MRHDHPADIAVDRVQPMNLALAPRRRRDDGAVVEQIVGEGPVRLAKRALDDRCAKAAGVDEQVGLEAAAVLGDQCRDITILAELDVCDAGVDMPDAPRGGDLAQEAAEQHAHRSGSRS